MTEAIDGDSSGSSQFDEVKKAAIRMLNMGMAPIPVAYRKKSPIHSDWASLLINSENIGQYFNRKPSNIGVLTGAPSGNLVDVDIDHPIAVRLGSKFIPDSGAIFGRKSKPSSHFLFYCDDMAENIVTFEAKGLGMIVELRGDSHQTVVPPSVHPSGETVEWDRKSNSTDIKPSTIDFDELKTLAGYLAATVLLIHAWPEKGRRNDTAGALAGMMLRADHEVDRVSNFIRLIATEAGDDEAKSRAANARTISKKIGADGKRIPGLPKLRKLIGADYANLAAKWLGISDNKRRDNERAPSLDDLLPDVELWHSEDGKPFATFDVDEIRQTHSVDGKSFKRWLSFQWYKLKGKPLTSEMRNSFVGIVAAKAQFEGEKHRDWLRVADSGGKLYLDLCDDNWTAVEIDAEGWRLTSNPPVRFRRGANSQPLRLPIKGGAIERLKPFLNLEHERDFPLIIAWAGACFRPDFAFPILDIAGEQGTAKSTATRVIKRLVDPGSAEGRGFPEREDDLVIAAHHNWIVSGDNVSWVSPKMADALCRLATGGGISKRELYTDAEEFVLEAKRPVILNGINPVSERQDVIDRMILVTLEPIDEENRRLESEFWQNYEAEQPLILGALLDGVSAGLSRIDQLEIEAKERRWSLPRLADFALWGEAIGSAFEWEEGMFFKAFGEMHDELFDEVMEHDLLGSTVMDWLKMDGGFKGTATMMLDSLDGFLKSERKEAYFRDRRWPKNAAQLANRLKRIVPGLRKAGVEFETGRTQSNTTEYRLALPNQKPIQGDIPF